MGELFQYYFEKNNISSIEPYLCLKMKELVGFRNKAVSDKNMYDYEKDYVLHGMKDVNEGSIMQIYPSPEFVYISQLEEIENICRVMHFKTICFYRRKNQFEEERANAKYIKEIISKAISFNPYISYGELVKQDLSKEIELELEYLIETNQLQSVKITKPTKYGNRKWRWR